MLLVPVSKDLAASSLEHLRITDRSRSFAGITQLIGSRKPESGV